MSKLLEDLKSPYPEIKYCGAKMAIALSKEKPEKLYPNFNFFVKLLDGDNQVMKWTAIRVIGNLAPADKRKEVDKLLPRLFGFLKGGKLITANNTIMSLTEIAKAKPEFRDDILAQMLKVEHYKYETEECRNIVIGKAISALGEFDSGIARKRKVINFLERQTHNTRNATKKKAAGLLRKLTRERNTLSKA